MRLRVYMSHDLDVLAIVNESINVDIQSDVEMFVSASSGYIVVKSGGRREQDIIKAFNTWLYETSQL